MDRPDGTGAFSGERLQNILARAGVASRRASAALIESGRVTVDSLVVREPGARFDPDAVSVAVDGRPIPRRERKRTIVLNKPAGVLSSMSDPFGGKTVADLLRGAVPERVVPVGRLDRDSEGLLVMSNDGDLALRLTHPRYGHSKTYVVKAAGRWSAEKLAILRGRVSMPDGYMASAASVRILDGPANNVTTLEFVLKEGRKRQIRYMCSAAHLVVVSLKRVAVGAFRLPADLAPGMWRDMTEDEIAGLDGPPASADVRSGRNRWREA